MRFSSLDEWLSWQEGLHPSEIDLGLERVHAVLARMGLEVPQYAVITIAGTNGKGSSAAMLAAIYQAAGYKVGLYTSPHLLRYNERIQINGQEVADSSLCQAFERIDRARAEISLTYFEFGTLAAIDVFARAGLDVAIMEVGLGGRLDAVNILDPDVALITSIALDHVAWLGNDREAIGREKAGIMRPQRPVVCADHNPPASIEEVAHATGAVLYRIGVDFDHQNHDGQWRWWCAQRQRDALPPPGLRGDVQFTNASAVLMIVELLSERLPVSQANVRSGLSSAMVAGRFQVLSGEVPVILDVAHNPQAAQVLANTLSSWPTPGRTHAIVAMMADKDIKAILQILLPLMDVWHVTSIDIPRSASRDTLSQALAALGCKNAVYEETSVSSALSSAREIAAKNDRIIVFGSFYTVAEALQSAYNTQ